MAAVVAPPIFIPAITTEKRYYMHDTIQAPRSEVVAAIEKGITAADDCFTPEQIADLREVGATATRIAVGTFQTGGTTCPVCAAGISDGQERIEDGKLAYGVSRFYNAFDDCFGPFTRVVVVTD